MTLRMPEMASFSRNRSNSIPLGFEAFLRAAPAKWVVYLLSDAQGRPVPTVVRERTCGPVSNAGSAPVRLPRHPANQLSRKSCERSIGGGGQRLRGRLVYYGSRPGNSFPNSYQGRSASPGVIHVNPRRVFRATTKTINLAPRPGRSSPPRDKHAAARLMQPSPKTLRSFVISTSWSKPACQRVPLQGHGQMPRTVRRLDLDGSTVG